MTLRYAHLATDDLDQCVIALDRVVGNEPHSTDDGAAANGPVTDDRTSSRRAKPKVSDKSNRSTTGEVA